MSTFKVNGFETVPFVVGLYINKAIRDEDSATSSKDASKNCVSHHVLRGTQLEVVTGSHAYGLGTPESDIDIYGFCIPSRHVIYPCEFGYRPGFNSPREAFEQTQLQHVKHDGKEFDLTYYNITKFFKLCVGCNPNMIDALFVPEDCLLHATDVGKHVLDNRRIFLSKLVYHRFRGFAYKQLSKASGKASVEWVQLCDRYSVDPLTATPNTFRAKTNLPDSFINETVAPLYKRLTQSGKHTRRLPLIAKLGYDPIYLSHVARLMLEAEQLLATGTLNLREPAMQGYVKYVKAGNVSIEEMTKWFDEKERQLKRLYDSDKSPLPYKPDEEAVLTLLDECLHMYYTRPRSFSISGDLLTSLKKAADDVRFINNEVY